MDKTHGWPDSAGASIKLQTKKSVLKVNPGDRNRLTKSINFVLQYSADCSAGSWEAVTNVPTLNLASVQYEMTFPLSGRAFYRLASR